MGTSILHKYSTSNWLCCKSLSGWDFVDAHGGTLLDGPVWAESWWPLWIPSISAYSYSAILFPIFPFPFYFCLVFCLTASFLVPLLHSSVFKPLKITLEFHTTMNFWHNMSSMGEIYYQWNSHDITEVVPTYSNKKTSLVFLVSYILTPWRITKHRGNPSKIQKKKRQVV